MLPRFFLLAPALAAIALAGCIPASTAPEAVTPVAGGDQCGASRVQRYVGSEATDAAIAAITRESGAQTIRRYNTGDAVTMDYRADRLNIEVGSDRRIVVLRCG